MDINTIGDTLFGCDGKEAMQQAMERQRQDFMDAMRQEEHEPSQGEMMMKALEGYAYGDGKESRAEKAELERRFNACMNEIKGKTTPLTATEIRNETIHDVLSREQIRELALAACKRPDIEQFSTTELKEELRRRKRWKQERAV